MPRYIWGVDSTATVTEKLYSSVRNNLGNPKFWGRYLSAVPGVSEGLTKDEISFIRSKGVKLLSIYNVFTEAMGYANGQTAARNAVFHSRRLGIQENTLLFANVERFDNVDEAWIRGWVETIMLSGYRSGIYHKPVEGDFSRAYCQAVAQNNQIAVQTILWSAEPDSGVSKERNAPKFSPLKPTCKANVWIWQYGRDVESGPIDTNLMDNRVLTYLS